MHQQELSLTGDLTFASVALLQPILMRDIEQSKEASLTVNLNGVLRSDSAGLALMIDGMKAAKLLGKELRYAHLPESLLKLAIFCNVEAILK